MPYRSKCVLLRSKTRSKIRQQVRGIKPASSHFGNTSEKIYYNADNPQFSYGNNSFSISIRQPSGSRMGSMVGW